MTSRSEREAEFWEEVREVFAMAFESTLAERGKVVQRCCLHKPELEIEVRSLLDAYDRSDCFLEPSILAMPLAAEEDSSDAFLGQPVGPYCLTEKLGEGGMGRVYTATRADGIFEKTVAIKILPTDRPDDELLSRFQNERRVLASLEHPHIARVLDGGATRGGLLYLVMERVEGRPITEHSDERRLTIDERLGLFLRVCAAVKYAHERFVVHRDLKPSNILVTREGIPKLLDFGIARILDPGEDPDATATVTELCALTPEYASPEHVAGGQISAASDVYSLGVLLYRLLVGRVPLRVQTRSLAEIVEAVCHREAPKPSVAILECEELTHERARGLRGKLRGDLDAILTKALQKDPGSRYRTVEELSEDIRRHLEALPVRARRVTFTYRISRFVRRHRARVTAALAASVLLAGVGLQALATSARLSEERRRVRMSELFGRKVEEIETSARTAALLPLHDGGSDRMSIRATMDEIERLRHELGPESEATRLYSLGQGFLALGEPEKAYELLLSAWEAGYQERDLVRALARATSILYSRAVLETAYTPRAFGGSATPDPQLLAARRAEERSHFRKAVEYLGRSQEQLEDNYVSVVLALFEDGPWHALEQLHPGEYRSDELVEVEKLKADLYTLWAEEEFARGNYRKSLFLLESSGAILTGVLAKVRSDAFAYVAECARLTRLSVVGKRLELPAKDKLEEARNSCDNAITAQSDLGAAFGQKSVVVRLQASYEGELEHSRRTLLLRESIDLASRAVDLGPQDAHALAALSDSHKALWWLDPESRDLLFHAEVTAIEQATGLRPNAPWPWARLGQAHLRRLLFDDGLYREIERGCRGITEAVGHYRKAVALAPAFPNAAAELSQALLYKARCEVRRGVNDVLSIAEFWSLRGIVLASDDRVYQAVNLSSSLIYLAESQFRFGFDPLNALRDAEHLLDAASSGPFKGNMERVLLTNLASAQYYRAYVTLSRGHSPEGPLQSALSTSLQKLLSGGRECEYLQELAETDRLRGLWAMQKERSPEASFQASESWLRRARVSDCTKDDDWYSLSLVAELHRDWAVFRLDHGLSATRSVSEGYIATTQGRERWPFDTTFRALEGTFSLLKAESQDADALAKQRLAHEAQAILLEVLEADPSLRREYGTYLERLEKNLALLSHQT